MKTETLQINKESWDEVAERFFARNPLPEYGPLAPTEDELYLFGEIRDLRVLDIGCGSGHSLKYMDEQGACELWGLDLSSAQIETAKEVLQNCIAPVTLFESPMEEDPGLPHNYFDIVYSIYALGWTADLNQTLANVNRYLKPGGTFIFSWEHPFYNRVRQNDHTFIFAKSYHEEGPYDHEAWKQKAMMQQLKVSTYVNTLIDQGFTVEKIVEEVSLKEEQIPKHVNGWYSYDKANIVPTTMIIKSRKNEVS